MTQKQMSAVIDDLVGWYELKYVRIACKTIIDCGKNAKRKQVMEHLASTTKMKKTDRLWVTACVESLVRAAGTTGDLLRLIVTLNTPDAVHTGTAKESLAS